MHTKLQRISLNYGLIINIYNAALDHKKHCESPHCNVSLTQLEMAAKELAKAITIKEYEEFIEFTWPI